MTISGFEVHGSRFDHNDTIARLRKALEERGISVFAHIDHRAGALGAGLELDPTDLFLVGNPKAGTALMQAAQTAGVDLPLRILIWTDPRGQTHMGFDDPHCIAARHGIADEVGERVEALAKGLRAVANDAVG